MALTRKMLVAMDISAEKIEEIIAAHSETVTALKEERDSLRADAAKVGELESKLDKANKALEELKAGDWENKYNTLKGEFDSFKTDTETKALNAAKESAYRALLKEAGIADKYFDKILKVTDLTKVSLDSEGKAVNSGEAVKAIKEEWSEFVVKQGTQGAEVATPPMNTGGSTFESMSLAEKMNYANEHPESTEVKAWLG